MSGTSIYIVSYVLYHVDIYILLQPQSPGYGGMHSVNKTREAVTSVMGHHFQTYLWETGRVQLYHLNSGKGTIGWQRPTCTGFSLLVAWARSLLKRSTNLQGMFSKTLSHTAVDVSIL